MLYLAQTTYEAANELSIGSDISDLGYNDRERVIAIVILISPKFILKSSLSKAAV